MRERDYYLGFSVFADIGPIRFKLIINYFGSAKRAWLAADNEYLNINLPGKIAVNFINFRKKFPIEKFLEELNKKKIEILCLEDRNYPENLKQIIDAPFVIYTRGNLELLKKADKNVAIVGTRMMTIYGKNVTEKIVGELTGENIVIVSGMAMGIDTIAHKTALKKGGHTIAVLGSGIDQIYPPANYDLYWQIIKDGSLVVSEYPPGFKPSKTTFPLRNRIISGIAKGIVVIEGRKTSGAVITAKYAVEQGREVFAVPGPVNSPMSAAGNYLIKQGANLATSGNDILEGLNIS